MASLQRNAKKLQVFYLLKVGKDYKRKAGIDPLQVQRGQADTGYKTKLEVPLTHFSDL